MLSFAAPVLLIGGVLIGLSLVGQIPYGEAIGQMGTQQIVKFLAVFGSGDTIQGAIVIGLTCSVVGALFDTYAFYRYQNFRG